MLTLLSLFLKWLLADVIQVIAIYRLNYCIQSKVTWEVLLLLEVQGGGHANAYMTPTVQRLRLVSDPSSQCRCCNKGWEMTVCVCLCVSREPTHISTLFPLWLTKMIAVEALLHPLFSTEVSKSKLLMNSKEKENLLMLMTHCSYINIYSQENICNYWFIFSFPPEARLWSSSLLYSY